MVQVLYAKELLANCLQTWLQKLVAYKLGLLDGSRQSNQIPIHLHAEETDTLHAKKTPHI